MKGFARERGRKDSRGSGEMKPSIDTANKLAEFLEVSLDYLTGNTDVLLDTNTLNRILEVQQLPDDVKDKLFYFIDMTVRD